MVKWRSDNAKTTFCKVWICMIPRTCNVVSNKYWIVKLGLTVSLFITADYTPQSIISMIYISDFIRCRLVCLGMWKPYQHLTRYEYILYLSITTTLQTCKVHINVLHVENTLFTCLEYWQRFSSIVKHLTCRYICQTMQLHYIVRQAG